MLVNEDSILEVEGLSKLYSRARTSSQSRLMSDYFKILFRRRPIEPSLLKRGEFWSLKDISFSLRRGEALGIIGLNGAGKTTLLRILAGQILPEKGEVRSIGKTAAMIDLTAGFNRDASGRRNIYLRGAMLGRTRAEIDEHIDEIIAFSELGDAIDAPFGTYSSGMSMRLAFSVMIASEPDILFIDEILSVGDFQFKQKCLAKIRDMRERVAFVLVSHSMNDIKMFCSKVVVLNKGRLAYLGPPVDAIEVYEKLQFPKELSQDKKSAEILKPQFHNSDTIVNIRHFWCDAAGKEIGFSAPGKDLFFKVEFDIGHATDKLILGLPVWTENGVYVTGFSTEIGRNSYSVGPDKRVEFTLQVPCLEFNPGNYISNIVIRDGVEFLYRGANKVLNVERGKFRSWGVVTLNHKWTLSK